MSDTEIAMSASNQKLVRELRDWYGLKGASCFREAADLIESLDRQLSLMAGVAGKLAAEIHENVTAPEPCDGWAKTIAGIDGDTSDMWTFTVGFRTREECHAALRALSEQRAASTPGAAQPGYVLVRPSCIYHTGCEHEDKCLLAGHCTETIPGTGP